MPNPNEGDKKAFLEKQLAAAGPADLLSSLEAKIHLDPTNGDPRFSHEDHEPRAAMADPLCEHTSQAVMRELARRSSGFSQSYIDVTRCILRGIVDKTMLAPDFVLGIMDIEAALGRREATLTLAASQPTPQEK